MRGAGARDCTYNERELCEGRETLHAQLRCCCHEDVCECAVQAPALQVRHVLGSFGQGYCGSGGLNGLSII